MRRSPSHCKRSEGRAPDGRRSRGHRPARIPAGIQTGRTNPGAHRRRGLPRLAAACGRAAPQGMSRASRRMAAAGRPRHRSARRAARERQVRPVTDAGVKCAVGVGFIRRAYQGHAGGLAGRRRPIAPAGPACRRTETERSGIGWHARLLAGACPAGGTPLARIMLRGSNSVSAIPRLRSRASVLKAAASCNSSPVLIRTLAHDPPLCYT
jgi:hypothetical protein